MSSKMLNVSSSPNVMSLKHAKNLTEDWQMDQNHTIMILGGPISQLKP